MKCRRAHSLFERSFEGTLGIEQAFELSEHVRECARCREVHDAQSLLVETLERLPEPPVERIDVERAVAAIHAELDSTRRTSSGPRAKPWVPLAAAAALAVTVGFAAWLRGRGDGGPDPDVATTITPAPLAPAEPPLVIEPVAELVPGPSEVDLDRLDEIRSRVRDALRAARPLLAESGAASFAESVELSVSDLKGWPVERIVARLTRSDDSELALAAIRYLGVRSSRAVLADLERALSRPDLERAGVLALVDAGDAGRAVLARKLWSLEHSRVAIDHGVAHPTELDATARAEWIAAALAAAPRIAEPRALATAKRLVFELGTCERRGAELCFELVDHSLVREEDLLDALARTREGLHVLEEILDRPLSQFPESFLLRAVARLEPPAGLAWASARIHDRNLSELALGAVAAQGGEGPLRLLLDLHRSREVDEPLLAGAWGAALDRDPERFRLLAVAVARGDVDRDASELLALLVSSGKSAAVPAILALLSSPLVAEDGVVLALLAVADFGRREDLPDLVLLLEAVLPENRRAAAGCLVAIHSIGGEDAVSDLFAGSETDVDRVLSLLASLTRGDAPSVVLFRVAMHLGPLLQTKRPRRQS